MVCAARGFLCPKHNTPLHTRNTKRSGPDIVTRYRVCPTPGCRYAVPTEERPRKAVGLVRGRN
jgi:hypothetical protein